MKNVKVVVARPVRVVINSANKRNQWGQIRVGNEILHTGQIGYIKRVAKARYNTLVG
jgi:hypothetical protein